MAETLPLDTTPAPSPVLSGLLLTIILVVTPVFVGTRLLLSWIYRA